MAPRSIAVIVCSLRSGRRGDSIARFVLETAQKHTAKDESGSSQNEFHLLDLADWPLPLFTEAVAPATITSSAAYALPEVRAFSAEISRHAAFIFVTPQYNWGYPASVKNAIDHLFHEWKGKPAMVVSYGGHGGGKAALQLIQVLQGLRMKVVESAPGLLVLDHKTATISNSVIPEGAFDVARPEVEKAVEELVGLLGEGSA